MNDCEKGPFKNSHVRTWIIFDLNYDKLSDFFSSGFHLVCKARAYSNLKKMSTCNEYWMEAQQLTECFVMVVQWLHATTWTKLPRTIPYCQVKSLTCVFRYSIEHNLCVCTCDMSNQNIHALSVSPFNSTKLKPRLMLSHNINSRLKILGAFSYVFEK